MSPLAVLSATHLQMRVRLKLLSIIMAVTAVSYLFGSTVIAIAAHLYMVHYYSHITIVLYQMLSSLLQGGAISADVGSIVNITSTQFSVCSAMLGGAIQSAGTVALMYTTLDSNTAEQSGGALHSTATGVITAAKCTFTNNKVH
jgi:predicted outer membrane repeat protein